MPIIFLKNRHNARKQESIQQYVNKTKQNKTEDAYLYDQATLFLRVILGESIDRFGMNSLPAGGDICKDVP